MHILEIGADQEDDAGGVHLPDSTFRTVPRDQTTFLIWKITESGVELLPRNHYGTFYDEEAYLIYSASVPGQPAGPDVIRREIKESGECPERHIHAWCGERAGSGPALRRAAHLAAHLAAPAVLHREAPAHESPRLLSYFKDGIRILKSGSSMSDGGSRLYRVRGRRPVLLQLEPVSWTQLAADGVFVLDSPDLLVLWLGRTANLVEKIFGAKIAYRMSRGVDKSLTSRRIVIAHDGYEQTLSSADRAALDALLELRVRALRPPPPAPLPRPARLYRATQPPRAAPSLRPAARLEEIKRAPLYREDLDDNGVYVVDGGLSGVWAWVGSRAGLSGARGALAAARGLARARRASGCAGGAGPVSATPAGREPLEFAALFHGWYWSDARRDKSLRAARSATTKLDAVSLATNAWLAAETQLADDGSGAVRSWRVRRAAGGSALADVERAHAAVFYDKDCYLVLYTYHAPTGEQSILYYWMGGSSSNDLRNLGVKEAKDLYTKLGRLPVQAWVYQGKEPAHFLQIFKGRMTTYVGSATDFDPSGRRVLAPARALIRVSGQYAREARGVEVRHCNGTTNDVMNGATNGATKGATNGAANGATNGGANGAANGTYARGARGACFVLREGARVWVWCASSATGDEREVAKNMAGAEHTLVMQGKEKPEFWAALGDRRRLLLASPRPEVERPLPPRLFYVSLGTPGQYSFEEIISFNQYELAPEMAAVLDAHCAVYAWLGAHCAPAAAADARSIAHAYLAQDPAARDSETPIFVIHQGREPPSFTGFFPHWKHSMWKSHKTFSAIINALEGKAIVQGGNSAFQSGNSANRFDLYEKYPIPVLRGPKENLPQDVDPLVKELYLTHDDFVATFNLPYSEFKSLPAWKQKDMKKAVGLF